MRITEKDKIKVYNYSPVRIAVTGRLRGYLFEPATDGYPSFEPMTFEDIEYINAKSSVFRTGALRFDKDIEAEIFKALGVENYTETLISEEDILDMLTKPSVENQERLLAIRNVALIERIRSRAVKMTNDADVRANAVMCNMVDARFREINRGIMVSQLKRQTLPTVEQSETVIEMKKMNEMLLAQMKEMQEQLAALQEEQKAATAPPKSKDAKPKAAAPRPKKSAVKEVVAEESSVAEE